MTNRKSGLSLECLEGRAMMAGDISAFLSGGHLFVTEASGEFGQGQAVQISQLADGRLRVKGVASQDGGLSLVNGRASVDFRVTGDLRVDLGAGNDTLNIIPNTAIKNIVVNMHNLSSVAGSDRDVVFVGGVRTNDGLTINTGVGDDLVQVRDTVVGDTGGIQDNLNINTGAGADRIEVYSTGPQMMSRGHISVTAYAGNEVETDNVLMRGVTAVRHIAVSTGAGVDRVDMTAVTSGTDVLVSAGAGSDTVKLREVRAIDDMWVYMEGGQDTLDVQFLNADELTLDGGDGHDVLISSVPGSSRISTRTGFEVGNGLTFATRVPVTLTVFTRV